MAETLGVASSIIAIAGLTVQSLSYVKAVHDAGKDIQDYNREAPHFTGLLTSLAAHVAQSGGQNGEPWFESVQTLYHGHIQQYQAALKRFKQKVALGTGLREKVIQRIAWKFVKDDVKEILERMHRLKSLIIIALQQDHFKLSEALRSIISDIKDDTSIIGATGDGHTTALAALQSGVEKQGDTISKVKKDTAAICETGADHTAALSALTSEAGMQFAFRENIISAENSKKKRELLEWLSDLDFSKQQHNHILNYTEGTGRWVLTDSTFRRWKKGVYSSLLCLGMPGAGKTVMSAMVIRHLSQVTLSDTNVAVAFVYFKYDERRTQSMTCIIGGLVKQLLSQAGSIPQLIIDAFEKRTNPGFQTPYQDMLQAAVENFKKVYLLIDALDEADSSTGRDLLSAIRILPRDKLRLLVTSRPIPEVQSQFHGDKAIEIENNYSQRKKRLLQSRSAD